MPESVQSTERENRRATPADGNGQMSPRGVEGLRQAAHEPLHSGRRVYKARDDSSPRLRRVLRPDVVQSAGELKLFTCSASNVYTGIPPPSRKLRGHLIRSGHRSREPGARSPADVSRTFLYTEKCKNDFDCSGWKVLGSNAELHIRRYSMLEICSKNGYTILAA